MATTKRTKAAAPPQYASYIDPESARSQPTELHNAFVEWLEEKTGVIPSGFPDSETAFREGVRLGTVLRMTYQKSDENQTRKADAMAERAEARDARKAAAQERRDNAKAKREEAAARKAEAAEKPKAAPAKKAAKKAAPKKTSASKAKADADEPTADDGNVTPISDAKGTGRRPARRRRAGAASATPSDF